LIDESFSIYLELYIKVCITTKRHMPSTNAIEYTMLAWILKILVPENLSRY